MKPYALRIDNDDSDPIRFKVTVSYHESDSSKRLGRSAEVVVYVERNGRSLPDGGPQVSAAAVEQAQEFLRSILRESP